MGVTAKAGDMIALCQKMIGKMAADKTGGACNEDSFHRKELSLRKSLQVMVDHHFHEFLESDLGLPF